MIENCLLAQDWNASIDPTGYWQSEKLDGWRAIWKGRFFISRNGNKITAPKWFTKDFPDVQLDGELYAGPGNLGLVISAVNGSRPRDWEQIRYHVFDSIGPDIFEQRFLIAKNSLPDSKFIAPVPYSICNGKTELLTELDEIVNAGGEGLMLRKPGSLYEFKRSFTLLKVKKWFDEEACIIAHIQGTRPGLCGSLKVINKDGKIFKVQGLTESLAHNPPPIGTIITYKYNTLTKEGIPRPGSFVRIKENI